MTGAGMQRTIEKVFFALLRFEINGTEICEETKNLIAPELLPALYQLSKRHDLAHLIGDALAKLGKLEDSEIAKRFLQERNMAVYRYEQIQYELEQICETLKEAKIIFIPLKGSVIRAYYPEPWMRTSCDIDVLVKEEDLERVIELLKEKLQYRFDSIAKHDAHLYAESGVHLELHYNLGDCVGEKDEILSKPFDFLLSSNDSQKTFSPEFFYLYHIGHAVRHFTLGGCGIRPFLDLWILKEKYCFDEEKLLAMLKENGWISFAFAACGLANAWFGSGTYNQTLRDIEQYLLYAGMYGDMKNRVAVQEKQSGSKFAYVWKRIFLSRKELMYQYPVLQKKPILHPFYTIKRWFHLLGRKKRKTAFLELKETMKGDETRKQKIQNLFENLGI